jgi:hypothetical protein
VIVANCWAKGKKLRPPKEGKKKASRTGPGAGAVGEDAVGEDAVGEDAVGEDAVGEDAVGGSDGLVIAWKPVSSPATSPTAAAAMTARRRPSLVFGIIGSRSVAWPGGS